MLSDHVLTPPAAPLFLSLQSAFDRKRNHARRFKARQIVRARRRLRQARRRLAGLATEARRTIGPTVAALLNAIGCGPRTTLFCPKLDAKGMLEGTAKSGATFRGMASAFSASKLRRSLEDACEAVGVKVEKCSEWGSSANCASCGKRVRKLDR